MGTSSLEIVEGLETVDIGASLWQREERELGDRPFILWAISNELVSASSTQRENGWNSLA